MNEAKRPWNDQTGHLPDWLSDPQPPVQIDDPTARSFLYEYGVLLSCIRFLCNSFDPEKRQLVKTLKDGSAATAGQLENWPHCIPPPIQVRLHKVLGEGTKAVWH